MRSELIIIGAGLGAESITLEGARLLKTADAVLYDRLVHPDVLKLIPVGAEAVNVGKDPYKKNCVHQEDINSLIRSHLKDGRKVVRLKGGDSTLFARSMEEADTASDCGAAVRIIPGVTSASTLTAKITGALTDRRKVSGCVFITGHTKSGECGHNWAALAALNMTIVVYMGVRNAEYIAEELMKNGMSPETATVIGSCLESENEKICVTDLRSLGSVAASGEYPHPATIVIGNSIG